VLASQRVKWRWRYLEFGLDLGFDYVYTAADSFEGVDLVVYNITYGSVLGS
jgi:hypothetical protein